MPSRTSSKQKTANKRQKAAEKPKTQQVSPDFSAPQWEFFLSKAKFSAYIGGIGSGKSFVGCCRILNMPAGSRGMVLAPSYKLLQDATIATFWTVLDKLLIPREYVTEFNRTELRMVLNNGTEILWRSAENPDLLRGPSLDWVYIDEGAYVSEEAWDIAIGRLRGSVGPHIAWITSTPNGRSTSWIWRLFVEYGERDQHYHLVNAPTSTNKHLPPDYIESLRAKYSDLQAEQELEGGFVDMAGARLKRDWLRFTPDFPDDGRVVVGVDLASSTSKRADWTAMVAVAHGKHRQHVIDADRHKLPFQESMDQIAHFCVRNRARIVYVEAVQYQMSAVQTLSQLLRRHGIIVKSVRPTGNKLQRFLPLEAQIQQGLITFSPSLPREYTDELLAFTGIKDVHDDQVDATVYACGVGSTRSGGVRDIDLL
jgi:predicted phage terminase large subunit-like protein